MLIELHIQNFALVDSLNLELGSGFNALTGETGAGKSIIIDAIGAALGERTGSEMVRTGEDKAIVEAIFDISDNQSAAGAAHELGFDSDDGLLILCREIARGGRSQCRINGRTTTTSVVKEISAHLVDIHGQHEHQSLLQVPIHIDIYDSWCGCDAVNLKNTAASLYDELSGIKQEKNRLQTDERERVRLLDLYKYQIEEINAADLQANEEEELSQERNRLANAEKLFSTAAEICEALGSEDKGAVDLLNAASSSAEKMLTMDNSVQDFIENLNSALYSAQEALSFINEYRDDIEANPNRLETVEDRLDLIRNLKRKYGDSITDIIGYAQDLAKKIDELEHIEDRSNILTSQIDNLEKQLLDICEKLSKVRKGRKEEFEKAIESELSELAMGKTRFEVSIERGDIGPKGFDVLEFLISANPGEPVKPLAKIASGGEMSRIMLALKTVAASTAVPTLVFDEIDTGIGGRTAQILGDKIASLAKRCQIICVTHLPQVASKSNSHYTISKEVESGRSFVRINKLNDEERVEELARMLGGEAGSTAAAQHAREMLSFANKGNS